MNVEALEKEFVGKTYVKDGASGDKVKLTYLLILNIISLRNSRIISCISF